MQNGKEQQRERRKETLRERERERERERRKYRNCVGKCKRRKLTCFSYYLKRDVEARNESNF